MSFTLGAAPQPMSVVLPRDADFVASMTSTTGVWPGTGETLKMFDAAGTQVASWAAVIAGATASWTVDTLVVVAVIAAGARTARLHHFEDGNDLAWAAGGVSYA